MYIRLSITDRCNLRCFYCRPKKELKPKRELFSYEGICKILAHLKELIVIDKLRITGGEPFVRKDLIRFLEQLNINGFKKIYISTNGTLIKGKGKLLKQLNVAGVNVSLDTLNRSTFSLITGKDKLLDVLSGIDEALEAGLQVKLNTVLLKGINQQEIDQLIDFAAERGVNIRFIELMPFAGTKEVFDNFFLPYTQVLQDLKRVYTLKALSKNGVAKEFFIEEKRANIGFITSVSKPFCKGCNRIRITCDGKIRACLHRDWERKIPDDIRMLQKVVEDLISFKRTILSPHWKSSESMVEIGG